MEFFYPNPAPAFLYSLVVGIVVGILYDILLIKRCIFKTGSILMFVEDVLFCLTAFSVLTVFILKANFGLMRWFELLCPFVSFRIYRLTFGHFTVKAVTALLKTAYRIVSIILMTFVLKPLWALIRLVKKIAIRLFGAYINKSQRKRALRIRRAFEKNALAGFETNFTDRK